MTRAELVSRRWLSYPSRSSFPAGGASLVCDYPPAPSVPTVDGRPSIGRIVPAIRPGRLGERARTAKRLRQLTSRTEDARSGWTRRFLGFHGRRDPSELGARHVSTFLSALATRGRVAASTQNQALAALLFLNGAVR